MARWNSSLAAAPSFAPSLSTPSVTLKSTPDPGVVWTGIKGQQVGSLFTSMNTTQLPFPDGYPYL